MTPMVSAVIPAFNEEAHIGQTVRSLRETGIAREILVVDDGSTDQTAAIAEAAGGLVVRLPANTGKGDALNVGAGAVGGDILLFLDADLGPTAAEAVRLVQPVLAGVCDVAIATFPRSRRKAGFGLAKGLARVGIRLLTGLRLEAPLSGQRALRREVWEVIGGCAPGFGAEVALTVDAVRAGFSVAEVPTRMSHAATGRDLAGLVHRGRQFTAVAGVLARRAACRSRVRGAHRKRDVV